MCTNNTNRDISLPSVSLSPFLKHNFFPQTLPVVFGMLERLLDDEIVTYNVSLE